jgi:hypothetical protein
VRLKRFAFVGSVITILSLGASSSWSVRPDARVTGLEIVRTDPATLRSNAGQRMLSRDDVRLHDFRGTHGDAWRVRWNEFTRTPHRAFGGRVDAERIAAGGRPYGARDKDAILRLAEAFVREHAELLGARWEELRPVYVGLKGGRWVVTLKQEVGGIEVIGGRVDLRFSPQGDLMMFGSDIYPIPQFKALPRLATGAAERAAMQGMPAGSVAAVDAATQLVLLPILADEPLSPGVRKAAPRATLDPSVLRVRPAYRVHVRTQGPPGKWVTFVDAATGQVLWRYNRVRFASASGAVVGDIHPLQGTDPTSAVWFPSTELLGGGLADTIAAYDFEGGVAGWSADSPWALSPERAHSGLQAWSDSPGANYFDNSNVALTSPKLNITSIADPVLEFWCYLQLEDTWDFLYIDASGDNGATWQTLLALSGARDWHVQHVDLSAMEGTNALRVRFRIWSDGSVRDNGAWIDDVRIGSKGSDVSDQLGAYSLTTADDDSTVTASLRGPFGQVFNRTSGGSDASLSVTPVDGVATVYFNDSNSLARERDTFYGLVASHARMKSIDPGLTSLDYPLPVFVGIAFCNAYWAGSQIVMGAGAGDCADLGTWVPVMYHEYAHGITDHVYDVVGDPPGDLHEAFSDYFASSMTGDPRVGPGILGPGTMFRTIENNLRNPEDYSGEVHIDGTILAGALWDLRQLLLPDVALADSLYHFARYGFPTSFEDYFIELLTVDDDNGDLGDGTPHIEAIRSAFGYHGIGLGPEFEHVHVGVQETSGNGDGRLDPGEEANLVLTLRNYGGAESDVSAKISTTTPGVTITADSVLVGAVAAAPSGGSVEVTISTTFHVQVDASVDVGTALLFELEIRSNLGFNGDSFMLPVGYVPILLVDDDRTRTFEMWYTDSLQRLGMSYTRWDAGILGSPSAAEMSEYRAVIWFTGNDRRNTLTPSDQAELAAYLDAGGNLFISGEDIGEDLWQGNNTTPTPEDKAFYEDYLRANVFFENEGSPAIEGEPNDLIGDGFTTTLNGGTSAGNQSSVSSITPVNGSVAALNYDNDHVAALRYDGVYKLFYCAFGFEGISAATDRDTLMARTLAWLCPDEDVAPSVTLLSPNGSEMLFEDNMHTIEWTATDDIAVLSVDIELSTDGGNSFAPIATGVTNLHAYDWIVDDTASDSCVIRVSAVDPSGNVGNDASDAFFSITKVTDVTSRLPQQYALHPAVPNPFNPATQLRFDLPRASSVWLQILSVDGRRVRVLVHGEQLQAGALRRTWDGRGENGNSAASGVYIVHLRAGDFQATRKIQLLR